MTTRTGERRTPRRIVFIRLRELEIHHVDLDRRVQLRRHPRGPVATRLVDDILAHGRDRDDAGRFRIVGHRRRAGARDRPGGPLISGEQADLLAWLSGRSPGTGLTVEGADEIPTAPRLGLSAASLAQSRQPWVRADPELPR